MSEQTTVGSRNSQAGPLTCVEWNRPNTENMHRLCIDVVSPVPNIEDGHKLEVHPRKFVTHNAVPYKYDVTAFTDHGQGRSAVKFSHLYGYMTPNQIVEKMEVPLEIPGLGDGDTERRDVRVYQNTKPFPPSSVIQPPCDITIYDIRPASENGVIVSLQKESRTLSD